MNIKLFNLCLLVGWSMVTAGGVLYSPALGLAVGGALLLVLTLASAYLGGLVDPAAPTKAQRAAEGA